MPQFAFTYSVVPERLLDLLSSHLPFSLSLLRRLQFTKLNGRISETARVILVSDCDELDSAKSPTKFTAAYVDVGGGRDTQMWLYSTLQDHRNASDAEAAGVCEEQLNCLVNEITKIRKAYTGELTYPGSVLLGSLHSSVRALLEKTGRVQPRATGNYDKWLFRSENIPTSGDELPAGMHWAAANVRDCHVVIARTDIPRTV